MIDEEEKLALDDRVVVECITCGNCGHVQSAPSQKIIPPNNSSEISMYDRWVGKIVIFQLTTGLNIQGRILAVTDTWIDTDYGAVRIDHIIHARWVSDEQASFTRGRGV